MSIVQASHSVLKRNCINHKVDMIHIIFAMQPKYDLISTVKIQANVISKFLQSVNVSIFRIRLSSLSKHRMKCSSCFPEVFCQTAFTVFI